MADVKRERWVVLDGYVYDVSGMVDRHPGGAALLERMRGRDISDVYHRIGHSSTARAWVEEGCVGVVNS
jgi:cytochrome b involved in lipid metabolism